MKFVTSATDDEKMMGEVMKMTMMLGMLMGGLRLGEHSHLGNQQLELNKLISVSRFAPPLPRGSVCTSNNPLKVYRSANPLQGSNKLNSRW